MLKSGLRHWLPVAALGAAIFVQSCFPSLSDSPAFPMQDKVLHVLVYALLAALFFRACRLSWPGWRAPLQMLALSVVFAALFGASDELHQSFVATRQADLFDLVADLTGGLLGGLTGLVAGGRPGKQVPPTPSS